MKHLSVLLLLLLSLSPLGVAAQEKFPVVHECEMQSEILGTTKKYCIYLPAGYADGERTNKVGCTIACLTAWGERVG